MLFASDTLDNHWQRYIFFEGKKVSMTTNRFINHIVLNVYNSYSFDNKILLTIVTARILYIF